MGHCFTDTKYAIAEFVELMSRKNNPIVICQYKEKKSNSEKKC